MRWLRSGAYCGPALVLVTLACAPDEPEPPPSDDACAGASCVTAGVPEGACGPGFASDAVGGCVAILPAEPCGPAEIAVPGDTTCRPIAACGEGTWGEIPIDATTVHVDLAYLGGDSDGSLERPFTSIQAAVDAAAPGAIVAVAAGTYHEDVAIADEPVRLWGRCPSLVSLVATGAQPAGILVVHASGSLVRGIAVTGPAGGVGVSGATDVRLESLWLHDLADRGIFLSADLGSGRVEIREVVVERAVHVGIQIRGYEALVERSVVRATQPNPATMAEGRGINVDDAMGLRSAVTVTGSFVEDNHMLGIYFAGSDGRVESTLVRGTSPQPSDGRAGRGIGIEDNAATGQRAQVTVAGVVLEQNHDVGIFVGGASATIDRVTVRETLPRLSTGAFGIGLSVERATDSGEVSSVRVSESLFEGNHEVGVMIYDATATMERSTVRATRPRLDGLFGDGMSVVGAAEVSAAMLTDVQVIGNARAGIGVFGSAVTLGGADLHCNAFDLTGEPTASGDFELTDVGDNHCGCDAEQPCQVVSATLAPPPPAGS